MKVSLIFSTYNAPLWLEKVFWGLLTQTHREFEVIVADDGSRDDTRALVDRYRQEAPFPLHHVWQPDDGFQKCRILNKAIARAQGEYLVFTDGDCIPRPDFLSVHVRQADRRCFLSGGYVKLPLELSSRITRDDVLSGRVYDLGWLGQQGLSRSFKTLKVSASGRWGQMLNWLSPAKSTWNGHNASCFREHAVAVNGFDERMQYGGEDVEFGERLENLGLRPKKIRYSTTCLHLEHGRGYVTEDMLRKNQQIREDTRVQHRVRAVLGLDQYI
ncbi:MAG: glycosyltransferase family 2 protein [Burkholderiaceae bacterium]